MKAILLLRKSCVISGLQQYTITDHLSLCWSTYFIKQKIQVSPVLALVLVRKEFCTACAEVFHNLALLSMKTSLLPLSFVFLAVYCKNCCTITWQTLYNILQQLTPLMFSSLLTNDDLFWGLFCTAHRELTFIWKWYTVLYLTNKRAQNVKTASWVLCTFR